MTGTESITYTRPRQEQLTIPDYIHLSESTEAKLNHLANLTGKSYSQIIDDSVRFFYQRNQMQLNIQPLTSDTLSFYGS